MAPFQMLSRLALPLVRPGAVDLPLASAFLMTAALAYLALQLGDSGFSPDSWGYFELAKTFFSDRFYQFNTYRSYFSPTHSTSFPLGYPFVIAVGHALFGPSPLVAVAVNIAAVLGTALLIIDLCRRNGMPGVAQAALALSLVLYPGYLDEVLAGRSIPLAILLFLGALRLFMAGRRFAGGMLLGLAALVRFDFLVFGLLFMAAEPCLGRRRASEIGIGAAGFLMAVSPWLVYSLTYFGKPWVSDNAWIALSASREYVANYPAAAASNIFNAPLQWLARVAANVPELFKYLAWWSLGFPLALALGVFGLAGWVKRKCPADRQTLLLLAVLLLSLGPYALTRYFDDRYFSLLFLAFCFLVMLRLPNDRWLGLNLSRVAALSLLIVLAQGVNTARGYLQRAALAMETAALDEGFMAALQACQKASPQTRYVFAGEAYRLAPRYGATTGGLAAFIPSNFSGMTEAEKRAYFEKMKPYVLVDKISESYPCPLP